MLYFVENLTSIGKSQLATVGLAHAWEEQTELGVRQCTSGPCGSNGVVLSDHAERCAYLPEEQIWREIPPDPAFNRRRWCGWWTGERPTPVTLARQAICAGSPVKLGDGEEWIIPQAVEVSLGGPRPAVPATIYRGADGLWKRGEVLPRYARLWTLASAMGDRMFSPGGDAPAVSVQLDEIGEVLGVNYRVGPDEVGALGLLDSTFSQVHEIIAVVCDLAGWRALEKKSAASGAGSMNAGGGG